MSGFINFFDAAEVFFKAQIIITSYFFRMMKMFFSQDSFFRLSNTFQAMSAEKQKRTIQELNALQMIRNATTKQFVFVVKFNRKTSETNNRISISAFREFNLDEITRFENIPSIFVMQTRNRFSHDTFGGITQFDEITHFMFSPFISRKAANVSDSFFLVVKLFIRVSKIVDRIIFEFLDSIENEFVDVREFSNFGSFVERHEMSDFIEDVNDLMMIEINDFNEDDDEKVRSMNKKRKRLIKKNVIFFRFTRSKKKKDKKKTANNEKSFKKEFDICFH